MALIRNIATINLNAICSTVKKLLLRDFVWNNDLDIIFMQEVAFENFAFINSHKALINISPDGKGTGVLLRNNIEYSDLIMNTNGRITSLCIDNLNFINIYAHSGSGFKKERDQLFTVDTLIHFKEGRENVMLGDFNCIIHTEDSNSAVKNISTGLKNLISSMNFIDVEKKIKGNDTFFTFYRNGSKSRLDRIYASKYFCDSVTKIETKPTAFSDHHCVFAKYKVLDLLNVSYLGRGYWKLNSSLLNDDEINSKFGSVYRDLQKRNSHSDINFWWNSVFKSSVKKFYKNESYLFNQQFNREKNFYYVCLNELFDLQKTGAEVTSDLEIVKSKLMEIENRRINLCNYKLKANSLLSDEKLGLFQISTKITRSMTSNVMKLRINGEITSDTTKLKKILFDHYQCNFQKQPNSDIEYENVLKFIKTSLDNDDHQALLKPIEEGELLLIIKTASKRTSPGPDGLCYNFYLNHFELLKIDLLNLFNSYLIHGAYPPASFSAGIITLIPKKGDNYDLSNKRPISMLNTDCKLFTKILWNRIQPLLDKLIGPGQAACVTDRSCVDNLRTFRNILIKANASKKFKGILMSLDLEKAFDRVDHDFLWAVLAKFNFPASFINCLKKLYKNATSQILFNGFLTSAIRILSSVRQGCPLSMALFALYIEPLIRMLYENIFGCLIANNFVKVVAYADDLNILVRNNHEFDTVLQLVSYFSIYSKIKLNFAKSQYLRFNGCLSGPHQIKEVESLNVLGVLICQNFNKLVEINYDSYLNKLKYTLSLHQKRILNLFQKAWLLNTYVLSKIWYICQIFPPNNKHLAAIKSICGQFIWQGFIFKVPRNELYLPVIKGGLALTDVESKAKSLFIKNILYSNADGNAPLDNFMLGQINNSTLTRNMREWIVKADELKLESHLNSSKKIYDFFIHSLNIKCKTMEDMPNLMWSNLLNNLDSNFLNSKCKTVLFCIFKDIVLNKKKLHLYGIRGTDSEFCENCGLVESVSHLVKYCQTSEEIWRWLKNILNKRLKILVKDPDELLSLSIGDRDFKYKAALWLTVQTIVYNLEKRGFGDLNEFKQGIRIVRFNNKAIFERHFKHFLNIF